MTCGALVSLGTTNDRNEDHGLVIAWMPKSYAPAICSYSAGYTSYQRPCSLSIGATGDAYVV
jgi:hypothetical protein